jgi:3D (Asp-Asp-Asp) domain-containing protein
MRQALIALTCALSLSTVAAAPAPSLSSSHTMSVTATAYCQHGTTASGTRARTGIVAADPKLLPVGSVLRILSGPTSGIYTVMDTGADIKGRRIDIFIPNCSLAGKFGSQSLRVHVIRRGWDPKATSPEDSGRP